MVPEDGSDRPQQRNGSKKKNARVPLASPSVKAPHLGFGEATSIPLSQAQTLWFRRDAPGAWGGSTVSPLWVLAPRDSARRGKGRGDAAPPPKAAALPGLTRRAATHALQVAAPAAGSHQLAGRVPALPAGGASLAGAEGAQLRARPPPKPRTKPFYSPLSRNCDTIDRPLV